jgi:hypothetical protein
MEMQTGGIGPNLVRVLMTAQPDLLAELLAPGRVLEADVVSVFQDRAILAFGKGARLEVTLQAELKEGQRVRVQVQPGDAPAVILKLVGQSLQPEGQTKPVAPQSARPDAQGGTAWLPVPLPDGRQGWAQIQVREEPEGRRRTPGAGAPAQVRLWWETPALGPVQVVLDTAGGALAALFTAPAEEVRRLLGQGFPGLQQLLTEAGYPEARLGCRPPPPGEKVGPAPAGEATLIDRRL